VTVSDIQRFCIHDGPGIRTTVFLKGCNLRCSWCHNPESIRPEPQIQLFPARCIGCGECVEVCDQGAHRVADGQRTFDRARCTACGRCAARCYADALVRVGRESTVDDVLGEVLADKDFYARSGGGVTISGGEPLLQRDFTFELLRACKQQGLHTAIETNLAWPWQRVASILPVTDLILFDLKLFDSAEHERWTGAGNQQILDNALRLSRQPLPLIVRTPVIVEVNATAEQIGRIADFIAPFANLQYYELLAYHPLGTGKYESLGIEYTAAGLTRPDAGCLQRLADAARQRGINVRANG